MSLWTAQQREWLQAMGHPVMALAEQGGEVTLALLPAAEAPSPAPGQRPGRPPPAEMVSSGPMPAPTPTPAQVSTASDVPASAGRRQLFRALLRATGQRTSRAAEQALASLDIDIDIDRLRDDPSAKRALWPRLRGLRRSGASMGTTRR